FKTDIKNKDFLLGGIQHKYDLIILNPPYIRQENLSLEYKNIIRSNLINNQIKSINGRSNLFIYFLYKSLMQLNKNGVVSAIVYDSIIHTQYGQEFLNFARRYFDIVKFENILAPFDGAMIDATVLIMKKSNRVEKKPIPVISEHKKGYIKLSELMNVKRGTTLPTRQVFLAHPEDGEIYKFSLPLIMKPYDRNALIVEDADSRYYQYGINREVDNFLSKKLEVIGAFDKKISFKGISGNILLNYYIRNKPKHLYNKHNISASDNFYVCKINEDFPSEVAWLFLNSDLYNDALLNSARNQGNGLKKLQLYEYKSAFIPDWRIISSKNKDLLLKKALLLIEHKASLEEVKNTANRAVQEVF
ncbi:MAG: hypothetical protein IE909_10530, partial [Campylobacterales bacterium]|nr:hypothetical protein [Campylobacterales bacterium]